MANTNGHGGKRAGSGRKKKEQSESFTQLAIVGAFKALPVLIGIIEDKKAKNSDKIQASKILFDRAFGSVNNMDLKDAVEKVLTVGYGKQDEESDV